MSIKLLIAGSVFVLAGCASDPPLYPSPQACPQNCPYNRSGGYYPPAPRQPVYRQQSDPLGQTSRSLYSLESILNSVRRMERTISGGY